MDQSFIKQHPYCDAVDIFAHFAGDAYALFFDSADKGHPDARYSYILINPDEVIETTDGITTILQDDQILSTHDHADPFHIARTRLSHYKTDLQTRSDLPPFQGGLAGLFGYDLFSLIEPSLHHKQRENDLPDMAIGIYNHVISFDHVQQKCWQIVRAKDQNNADNKMINIAALSPILEKENPQLSWHNATDKNDYKQSIKRVIDSIIAGDIFQANLSQRFAATLPDNFDPYSHYKKLRHINGAPYAAYFNTSKGQVSSASPELLLKGNETGCITTKPIKGTAPRRSTPATDKDAQDMLQNNKKDRAENIMITDLLRNDLSKCCVADSIHVPSLCAIESFEHIHHLVSTVTGQLDKGQDNLSLLRGCFPGGSITGAPKIRSIEIINELEHGRRHGYCGSLAMIGYNGYMSSNILIRTIFYDKNSAHFNVGGGITYLSDPDLEYEETLHKAQKIFDSFDHNCSIKGEKL